MRYEKAPSGNQVSQREPPAAPPDPYAAGCLRRDIEGVTQKMLSQTPKQMDRDGLITRTVLPTMPVSVEYAITPLGQTLAAVLDGLQVWARDHIADVLAARRRYDGGGHG